MLSIGRIENICKNDGVYRHVVESVLCGGHKCGDIWFWCGWIGVLMVILCGPRLECIVVLKLTIVCGAWNR